MLTGIIPTSWTGPLHAALRVITGLLFLEHGMTKLLHWPATEYFPAGQPLPTLMLVAGILELVGGVLIIDDYGRWGGCEGRFGFLSPEPWR